MLTRTVLTRKIDLEHLFRDLFVFRAFSSEIKKKISIRPKLSISEKRHRIVQM